MSGLRGSAAWAGLDFGASIWNHRAGLGDPVTRKHVARHVAWDGGEAIATAMGSSGAAALVAAALVAAEGATFVGAAALTTPAAVIVAPPVVGAAGAYAAVKAVQAIRRLIGPEEYVALTGETSTEVRAHRSNEVR
jgi:hypothetical protein